MRSDLNEFLTRYLSIVGAAVMLVGFVAFVITAYDGDRADKQAAAQPTATTPASTTGS